MIKMHNKIDRSEQILRVVLVLIVAWILASLSKIFLEKGYCILKFYIENRSFGRPEFCELLPGFYAGTILTTAITIAWFIILFLLLNIIKGAKTK